MTAGTAGRVPRPALRLLRLHAASRRIPAALALLAACAAGMVAITVRGAREAVGD